MNDVQFLDDVVMFMEQSLHIDAQRVYAAGYSMGGMMAYRLACELPNRFAAVASVASTMPDYLIETCTGTPPIPVIVFQGTDDPVVPWTGIAGGYLSAAQTIGFWGNHNQLHAAISPSKRCRTPIPSDYTLVMRQHVDAAAPPTWCSTAFTSAGIPGPDTRSTCRRLGRRRRDIDATAVMWDFFNAHPKTRA